MARKLIARTLLLADIAIALANIKLKTSKALRNQ
jgi:hypothetical protein